MDESDTQRFRKYALQACDAFDAYFEILQPLIEEKFPEDTKALHARMQILRKNIGDISPVTGAAPAVTLPDEKSATSLYGTVRSVSKLYALDEEITILFASFEAPRLQSLNISNSNISGTNRLEIVDAFEDLTMRYTRAHQEITAALQAITQRCSHTVADEIYAAADPIAVLTQFHELALKSHAYDMYLDTIRILISRDEEKKLAPTIERLLEADKNAVLIPADAVEEKSRGKKSFPCRRLGLLPHDLEPCLPRELYGSIYGTAKETTFDAWSRRHNVAILVLNSVAYSVVEYKMGQLFKKDAALMPAYGISGGIIARTGTIRTDEKAPMHKFDFSAEVHNEDAAATGFVFETLDGKHYRVLHRKEHGKSGPIAPFDIRDIIKYFKMPSMHTRVSTYQDACNAEACRRMMVRKQPNMNLFEVTSTAIDTNYIKNQIVLRLNGVLHTQLTRGDATSEKDIMRILHSPQLVDEFAAAILDFYKIGAVGMHDFSGGMFPFSEMLSTFLVEVENLRRQFIKELHDGYTRTQSAAAAAPAAATSYEVQRRLETLIIDVVQTVIPADDNIYSSLNYKYMLLNYDR